MSKDRLTYLAIAAGAVLLTATGCRTQQDCQGQHDQCLPDEICNADNKCERTTCGDGVARAGEECDEGSLNGVDGETCTATCTINACGDGHVGPNEECDDGPDNSDTTSGACRTDCLDAHCGDSVIDLGEECDLGPQNSDLVVDACRTSCRDPHCGDGVMDTGEPCDDGANNGVFPSPCTVACEITTCGDGYAGGTEQCDGADLGGADCQSIGLTGGTLACQPDCSHDTAACWSCGDGACDHALGENTGNCVADCGWVHVAAGDETSCGVKADGSAWCWGRGDVGQIGDGLLNTTNLAPQQVVGLSGVTRIDIGIVHQTVCALSGGQSAWCWGEGSAGQLGNGAGNDSPTPVAVSGLGPATDISGGTCALTASSQPWCWGLGGWGQLGNGQSTATQTVPVPVSSLLSTIAISRGFHHVAALEGDGSVWNWGYNHRGQLGIGTSGPVDATNVPVQVPGVAGVVQLSAGRDHTCVVLSDGTARCWGAGTDGRLGSGANQDSPLPTVVIGLSSALAIDAGSNHSCAVLTTGSAECWGSNLGGQLGDGTTTDRNVTAPVMGLNNVSMISTARFHTCALTNDGNAWCWGANTYGQLGDATTNDSLLPSLVGDPYQ